MDPERPDKYIEPQASNPRPASDDKQDSDTAVNHESSDDAACRQATVLVRGETIRDQQSKPAPQDPAPKNSSAKNGGDDGSAGKEVSEAKIKMQRRLPVLDDDAEVGVQKEQLVIRDEKADLAFTGTLIASAAPASAPKGHWEEYRIYETDGGKHVFSKVARSVFADEQDHHEAEVFDPAPTSVPSQLLRSARDLTRSHPVTWTDGAVSFFGYDPLAKTLYRKLGDQFDEHIS